jgi:LysR family transcriptional regulator, low CO2-responsive transcriptional regulator
MPITLTQLHSFLAVVRSGSVSAAANQLVVTQPSVSAAVRALSREVGADLLEREGRGVRPTAAGAAFAPFAADVIGLLENGRRAAHEAATEVGQALRIGAVTTAAESFVPLLMRAFAETHPGIQLTLSVGNRGQILEMIGAHTADVAFGGRAPEDVHITSFPFLANELVLVTDPHDPLAGSQAVDPSQLSDRTWLLREPGSGTRTVNEKFLAANGLEAEALTVGSNGAIKRAAHAGLGVSFVSRDAVALEVDAGILGVIGVRRGPAPRRWQVMRSSVGPVRPVVEEFLEFVLTAETIESLQSANLKASAPVS